MSNKPESSSEPPSQASDRPPPSGQNQVRNIYAIFHLNLAFSSIDNDDESHLAVIEKCYWPLLSLIDLHNIPLGLELTRYTLDRITELAPSWTNKFRTLLIQDRCEILASGDNQVIGPLVPADLNLRNLNIAQKAYKSSLGVKPNLAYINEQAVSRGLLDVYLDAGFKTIVMEWDNPYSHNTDWSKELLNRPQSLLTAGKRSIQVIWNNAIAFQKLQRYAHGEIILEDYLSYLNKNIKPECKAFSIYGSDAEVFDFRPGRYQAEAFSQHSEWDRIVTLFKILDESPKYQWIKPSEALAYLEPGSPLSISSATHPISVKKQAKYNITRWGLSGRNDLRLNTLCFRMLDRLREQDAEESNENDDTSTLSSPSENTATRTIENPLEKNDTTDAWVQLCQLWASDLRTHLNPNRYSRLINHFPINQKTDCENTSRSYRDKQKSLTPFTPSDDIEIKFEKERNKLHIRTPHIHLTLNANRGLSIEKLAFSSQDFKPVCGTLPHGRFDHIRYGVDFYSNHLVMERFKERDRVTDLGRVTHEAYNDDGKLVLLCTLNTPHGELTKSYCLDQESLECSFEFSHENRPEASLRLGFVSLLNCSSRPWFACHNGGENREYFMGTEDFDHGAPVSSIVSATNSLGATTGEVLFGTGNNGVSLTWDQSRCAALPMLSSKAIDDEYLNRCWFSLIEADETLKAGGMLPAFSYCIKPCNKPQAELFL